MERVIVSIDGSNFYHQCLSNLGRTDVNLGAFAEFLVGPGRSLVRTYYYNCLLASDIDEESRRKQQLFYGALYRIPYLEVRLGRLVRREFHCKSCNATTQRDVEKGVDMRIGIDMLVGASRDLYDTAILVSGDGDLSEAVKSVKELGKHVELAALALGRSYELVQVADVVRDITAADMASLYVRKGGRT